MYIRPIIYSILYEGNILIQFTAAHFRLLNNIKYTPVVQYNILRKTTRTGGSNVVKMSRVREINV